MKYTTPEHLHCIMKAKPYSNKISFALHDICALYMRPQVGGGYAIFVVLDWADVAELELSYHNPETILFTIDAYYGNLTYKFLSSNPVEGSVRAVGLESARFDLGLGAAAWL